MKIFGIDVDEKFIKSKEGKFLMISSALVVLILVGGIGPSSYNYYQIVTQTTDVKGKILRAQQKIRNLPELRKKKEEHTAQLKSIEAMFLDVVELPSLIGIISEQASEAGIQIFSSKPKEYSGSEILENNLFYRPFILDLEVAGDYHQLGTFVNLLETYEKWFRINEMNIAMSKSDDTVLNIKLSIITILKK